MDYDYHPEIDGLRAIAVLSVVLFDADFILPGGYLGLNVLFVISGYLLTTIITNELQTNSFSCFTFCERRLRRLLPCLVLVLLCTLPLASKILLPIEMEEFCKLIIGTFCFKSSFTFMKGKPHTNNDATLASIAHTWSLSIEQQFSIVLVPLLVFIHKYLPRKLWTAALFTSCCSSFLFGPIYLEVGQMIAFCLLPGSLWQILAGSILCQFSFISKQVKNESSLGFWLPGLGLVFIIGPMLLNNQTALHPSCFTLFPLVGTSLVIKMADNNSPFVKILTMKPIRAVGLLSYGIYLWHFLVFALAKTTASPDKLSTSTKFYGLLCTILLSAASYFLVEAPLRNNRNYRVIKRTILTALSIFIVLSFAIGGLLSLHPDLQLSGPTNHTSNQTNRMSFILYRAEHLLKNTSGDFFHSLSKATGKSQSIDNFKWYTTRMKPQRGRIILAGDSHAGALGQPLVTLGNACGFDVASVVFDGCLFAENLEKFVPELNRYLCTAKDVESAIKFILKADPSFIIYTQRFNRYIEDQERYKAFGGQKLDAAYPNQVMVDKSHVVLGKDKRLNLTKYHLQKTLETLSKAGHKIIALYPLPETKIPIAVPSQIHKLVRNDHDESEIVLAKNPITMNYTEFKYYSQDSHNYLDSLGDTIALRAYPEHVFCNNLIKDLCLFHDSRFVYYRDTHHLAYEGAFLQIDDVFHKLFSLESNQV